MASRDAGKLRLWAVDLTVSPTASLSGFQLFDFLAAGQFDPTTGAYWVPGMADVPADALPNQQAEAHPTDYPVGSQVGSQEASVQHAIQPPEHGMQQDAAALAEESCDGVQAAAGTDMPRHHSTGLAAHAQQVSVPSTDAGRERGTGQRQPASVADQRPLTGRSSDTAAEAATWQQGAVTAPRLTAGTDLLTKSSDDGQEFDESEAALGPVAAFGNRQEQSLAETAIMPENDQNAGLFSDRPGIASAAWQQSEPAIMQHEVQLEPRFYAAIDLLFHSGMHKCRSAEFLQNCRVAGLGFDMMARQGLVLNVMDSMASCCLGVQCAGATPQLALQGLSKVMTSLFVFGSLTLGILCMQP